MNVVVIGGNDCMVCEYKAICKECGAKAKVFTQPKGNLEGRIGNPDLIVLFTRPVSHEMVKIAKRESARKGVLLIQSHCGSAASLKNILAEHSKRKPVRAAASW
ncbi:MAG: DUF2325 domain-containing protein [Spirochaetaceae bacterium]|jgi:hypothetical protein|nr:DUF2325 domain-containing protein [Spirochaetaceae bacterium]